MKKIVTLASIIFISGCSFSFGKVQEKKDPIDVNLTLDSRSNAFKTENTINKNDRTGKVIEKKIITNEYDNKHNLIKKTEVIHSYKYER